MDSVLLFMPEADLDDFSRGERAFLAVLGENVGEVGSGVHTDAFRYEDGPEVIALLSLHDRGPHDEHSTELATLGVHFTARRWSNGRARGDRLHNQLFHLPDEPSPWGLDTSGAVVDVGKQAAAWVERQLRRPVLLYVWVHNGHAYASRYLFADTDETLCQTFVSELAPPGQEEELIAAGHVRGRGWPQTRGLPEPRCYFHIRGDLDLAVPPLGVPRWEAERRGPIHGVRYE